MRHSTARWPHRAAAVVLVPLFLALAAIPAGSQEGVVHEPLAIADVSHINHSLVLIDEYERRFRIPDATYASDSGRSIVIREGKIVELKGCADADCTVTAHATRVGSRLAVYAEIVVPDGTFRSEVGAEDEAREVLFTIEGGRLTSFLDPAQEAFDPEAASAAAASSDGPSSSSEPGQVGAAPHLP